ncbi:hypothetical protein K466DRAFT_576821 [Polyporus arcularius HHB13444]|uniref:Uncharacterized protein n=1 Tax=Polyporus arcularius HHB13444 TaxID=1314778 RepID=A0A5C3P7A0_9APHY|nr:hypothetical protein K466DRAFT_576821 [Polyporus arcularius HHB13444]
MASSNLTALTKSHTIIAAKKKAKREQIKEVLFDDTARREFLTGFHKRKLEKKEQAKKKAQEREKQDRLEARREHRRMLAEQAKKNAADTERAYGAIVDSDSDSEWDGIGGSGMSKGKRRAAEAEEEEFEDEEQLATVTVVEEFDPDSIIHGPGPTPAAGPAQEDGDAVDTAPPQGRSQVKPKHAPSAVAHTKAKMKASTKAKDIKYQTNAARKFERQKQRNRKIEKADRAGGKGSKKKSGPKGRR